MLMEDAPFPNRKEGESGLGDGHRAGCEEGLGGSGGRENCYWDVKQINKFIF